MKNIITLKKKKYLIIGEMKIINKDIVEEIKRIEVIKDPLSEEKKY